MQNLFQNIELNSKICVFSTSIIARYLSILLNEVRPDIKILYFIDSFKKGSFCGKNIITLKEAQSRKQEFSKIIVASVSGGNRLSEILEENGIKDYLFLTEEQISEVKAKIISELGELHTNGFLKDKDERYPAGHYYSAVPSDVDFEEFLKAKNNYNFEFKGIDLNLEKQLENLDEFNSYFDSYFKDFSLPQEKTESRCYFTNNIMFFPDDAYSLAGMILKYKPKRIIEIGSGFSTGVMVDVNTQFFNSSIDITCIEPFPDRLKKVMQDKYKDINVYEKRLQEVDTEIFNELNENDLLFVDSSHVAKMNSDVLKIMFKILPSIEKGVIIHFHDIFNDFSYPDEWVNQKRCWNEAFILRAFLQYNNVFQIEYFADFLKYYKKSKGIKSPMPLEESSGSIYIRKTT